MEKQSIQLKDLLIPGAIVAAGIIVAFTIVFMGGIPKTSGTESQEKGSIYTQLAKEIGVNMKKFEACVAEKKYQERVQGQLDEGVGLGVEGTPGSFVNGTVVRGAIPYDALKGVIDAALAGTKGEFADKIQISDQDHIRGSVSAPVTIVEFSDLQCPFCGRFHPTLQKALQEYGDKVRWVYKHFPLDSIHAQARPAAEAAECIAEQKGDDGFWKFTDGVFKNQDRLEDL